MPAPQTPPQIDQQHWGKGVTLAAGKKKKIPGADENHLSKERSDAWLRFPGSSSIGDGTSLEKERGPFSGTKIYRNNEIEKWEDRGIAAFEDEELQS